MSTAELPATTVLERADVDWERHKGTGAPKILPPPGVEWRSSSGKSRQRHRYFTRVTTYADAISDQYNLMQWKMERVLLGLGQRPDYVRLASALTDRDDDRDARRELVAKTIEAAGPNRADEGTALHALFERIDRGEPLGNPPPELVPDLTAYEALSTEAFRWVWREARTVCDELEVAGTPDGLAHVGEPCPAGCAPGVLHIGDSKTGSIRYPAKMGIQLAIYARSARYDPATGARSPLGGDAPVCTRWGFIVHSPVESGRSAPYWLDLELGWAGALLCGPVREWNARRADELLVPFTTIMPMQATPGGAVERGEVRPASYDPREKRPPAAEPAELPPFTLLGEQVAAVARGDDPDAREAEQLAGLDGSDDPIAWCDCRDDEVCPPGQLCRRRPPHRFAVGEVRHDVELCATCGLVREDERGRHLVGAIGEAVVESEDAADLDGTDDPGRCELSGLLVGECACRVHRPDLADVGDDGVQPEPELPELEQRIADAAERADATGEPQRVHPDPTVDAIRRCITDRDLELLWQASGSSWSPGHRELAAQRMAHLRAERDAERPRAALGAAILACTDRGQLAGLMAQHGDDPWVDEGLRALASERYRELPPAQLEAAPAR